MQFIKLKISDKNLISNFLNDYIMKNYKNIFQELTFKELYKFNIIHTYNNINLFSFLKQKCIIYDYESKGIVPIDYLRHIYNEFCFKNNRYNNENEFFGLVCICKKNINSNHLYDINYNNLVIEEKENSNVGNNNNDDDYNLYLVKNFIDSIMSEELEKLNKRKEEKNFNKYK